jgi:hypothetical protein
LFSIVLFPYDLCDVSRVSCRLLMCAQTLSIIFIDTDSLSLLTVGMFALYSLTLHLLVSPAPVLHSHSLYPLTLHLLVSPVPVLHSHSHSFRLQRTRVVYGQCLLRRESKQTVSETTGRTSGERHDVGNCSVYVYSCCLLCTNRLRNYWTNKR